MGLGKIEKYLTENPELLIAIQNEMKEKEKQDILNLHPYKISEGKNKRWFTRVIVDGKPVLVTRKSKAALEDYLYNYYSKFQIHEKAISMESLFPEWLERKKNEDVAPETLHRFQTEWNEWYKDHEIVKIPIQNLTKALLEDWCNQVISKVDRNKKHFYNIKTIGNQILDYAVDAEYISDNLLRKVKFKKGRFIKPVEKTKSRQVFTNDELDKLFTIIKAEMAHPVCTVHILTPLAVLFQFLSGLRVGELCAIRYEDVDYTNRKIRICRMYRYSTKEVVSFLKCNYSERFIPLTKPLEEIVNAAQAKQQEIGIPDNGYIFSINDEPLPYETVKKAYTRYCKKIGTVHKGSHTSRKTFISMLIDEGISTDSIRTIVGHADERTTLNNYHFQRNDDQKEIKVIEEALQRNIDTIHLNS